MGFEVDGRLREVSRTVSGSLRLGVFTSALGSSSSVSRFRLFFFFFLGFFVVSGSCGAFAFPLDAKMSSISDFAIVNSR